MFFSVMENIHKLENDSSDDLRLGGLIIKVGPPSAAPSGVIVEYPAPTSI